MKLHYQDMADCILVDKFSGMNTHASDLGRAGLVELLEESFGQKLFVVHRLDKGTSGALIFAKTSEGAKDYAELFEKHEIAKRYLFLTDRKISPTEIKISSHIEKEKGQFVSHRRKEDNAHTHLLKIRSLPQGDLWEARPMSGKPHQIRLHAAEVGLSILGDEEHGGTPFFRMCLHSLSLEFTWKGKTVLLETAQPSWSLPCDSMQEVILREAYAQRERLFGKPLPPNQCLRISHNEIDSYRIDQFGDCLWVYWYHEEDPRPADLERFQKWALALDKKIFIRKMLNRGEDPQENSLWQLNSPPETWVAQENDLHFELRAQSGLSPGLFLDQRENRRWVLEHAKDRSVLNLFSYTGGFSVSAAVGGALEVVTVDVSTNFLEWSKKNFQLNQLDDTKYEFWASDVNLFLKGCLRRKRKFDLIICDPPSFGRSKDGVFSISKNYEELVINCLYCLNKNGLLLFSTNYEKWTLNDLKKNLNRLKSQFSFQLMDGVRQGLDYELPDQEPLMKSVLIRKS